MTDMPRNSQGVYSLPPGNPVVAGTLIESDWANDTMTDLAQALTDSLPRNGSAPMTGLLTLSGSAPTNPTHAASKAYVDQFVSFATGMPVGSVIAFASGTSPPGFLLCNGQAVSRTTYAALFAAIGTTFGAGDSSTTFNVPNLEDQFIRGKGSGRTIGSIQADLTRAHAHAISDPGHSHGVSDPSHTHGVSDGGHAHGVSDGGHSHGVSDPGHSHGYTLRRGDDTNNTGTQARTGSNSAATVTGSTNPAGTGISIAGSGANISIQGSGSNIGIFGNFTGVSVAGAFTGVQVGTTGGAETRPQNIAFDYYIKALNDAVGPAALLGITSADTNLIDIDSTLPSFPQLVPKANVSLGMVKLDINSKIPAALLPSGGQSFLGPFDASGGNNPSQAFPSQTFVNGNTYVVAIPGSILVFDVVTKTSSIVAVTVGDSLLYLSNGIDPVGWYHIDNLAATQAASVAYTPAGDITATNVQSAITELDTEKVPRTATTGAAVVPAGTTAQRPGSPVDGLLRFNATLNQFEGFFSGVWQAIGGGQMLGVAQTKAIFYNSKTISENLSIIVDTNGLSAGPITISDGFTVTVPDGSVWSVV